MTLVLKTALPAYTPNKFCGYYRAVIRVNLENLMKSILVIEQKIGDEWCGTGGQWYIETLVKTLMKPKRDAIYIDMGQGWYVSNFDVMMEEALIALEQSV